jgi:AcrR family transcriptional regulator
LVVVMAQYLKDDVQQRIAQAALTVFAEKGYHAAAMAEIAKVAGVSTGNIYRYYANKDALFYALVTDAFAERFLGLFRQRVMALDGVVDLRSLPADAGFHRLADELLQFCIEHRLQVVILLDMAAGSRFETVGADLQGMLVDLAIRHFRGLNPALEVDEPLDFTLRAIYRQFVTTMVGILRAFERPQTIREAVAAYSRYHLTGLNALFGV